MLTLLPCPIVSGPCGQPQTQTLSSSRSQNAETETQRGNPTSRVRSERQPGCGHGQRAAEAGLCPPVLPRAAAWLLGCLLSSPRLALAIALHPPVFPMPRPCLSSCALVPLESPPIWTVLASVGSRTHSAGLTDPDPGAALSFLASGMAACGRKEAGNQPRCQMQLTGLSSGTNTIISTMRGPTPQSRCRSGTHRRPPTLVQWPFRAPVCRCGNELAKVKWFSKATRQNQLCRWSKPLQRRNLQALRSLGPTGPCRICPSPHCPLSLPATRSPRPPSDPRRKPR